MVYVVIDEKKKKGKALLNFLKQMDEQGDFIGFADEKPKPDKAVTGKLTASEFLEKWSGIASCKESENISDRETNQIKFNYLMGKYN